MISAIHLQYEADSGGIKPGIPDVSTEHGLIGRKLYGVIGSY